jgi:hypothetical protein
MSESQSFVETTLPPGYNIQRTPNGFAWRSLTLAPDGLRPSPWRHTRGECCRLAWRHWTATVLRGRTLKWVAFVDGSRGAYTERDPEVYVQSRERRNTLEVGLDSGQVDEGGVAVCAEAGGRLGMHDVDEAMARFAWLVGATEGMVPR